MLLAAGTADAAGLDPRAGATPEYMVKAAFIYNLASFVEWPPDAFPGPDAPVVLGIVGKDPFGGTIDDVLKDKKVHGRSLVVRRLEWGPGLRSCNILFFAPSETSRLGDLAGLIGDLPILTLGDEARAAARGCVVAFTLEDERVGLEINVDAAVVRHLTISSKVLNLARVRRDRSRSYHH